MQAGGRYSHNTQDATQTTSYNPQLRHRRRVRSRSSGNSSENVWTYSVAPSCALRCQHHGLCASGDRLPPGRTQRAAADGHAGAVAQYGAYGSDKTTNVELGMRSTQLDGRFSLDLALFHVDWKDIQLFEQVVGPSASTPTAAPRAARALEWNFGYLPPQGLTFQWTGAFTDAQLTSDATQPSVHWSGSSLPWAPKWSTGLTASTSTPRSEASTASSAQPTAMSASATRTLAARRRPTGQIEVGSYSTYDARLGVGQRPLPRDAVRQEPERFARHHQLHAAPRRSTVLPP